MGGSSKPLNRQQGCELGPKAAVERNLSQVPVRSVRSTGDGSVPLALFRCRRGRGAGFTLVELLAAIAIVGTVAALAIPKGQEAVERARVVRAIGDIFVISMDLDAQDTLPDNLAFFGPIPIDPWGNPYQYNKFPVGARVPPGARRDRFLVPINTTYDLYSRGRDGASVPPLTARASQDDVVRANDGGFIGLGARY